MYVETCGTRWLSHWFAALLLFCAALVAPSPPPLLAAGQDGKCEQPTVVSVAVAERWPRICEDEAQEKYCWREIEMFMDGRVELSDADGMRKANMSAQSLVELKKIVSGTELLSKLRNPLSPDCEGHDGIHMAEIRVELSNGASMSTRWAGGCLEREGHPFKLAHDLAVKQRIDHVECEPFESALCDEGFDPLDYYQLVELSFSFSGRTLHGLCFPCCGSC
ncbi:MAG: hypothetical protein PHU25_05645 [Deltaproteobacteria bacterium]|nr:hypothetical protein [Deltaproteobacteria bacterium]